jgi:hypothetical protein
MLLMNCKVIGIVGKAQWYKKGIIGINKKLNLYPNSSYLGAVRGKRVWSQHAIFAVL